MRSFGAPRLGFALILGVLVLAGGFAAFGPAAAQSDGMTDPDQAHTTLEITLSPDGDASWSVILRFELDADNEEAFDRLARDFEGSDSSIMPVGPFEEAAALASEATGRSMRIQNVSRSAYKSETTGLLVLRFEWTNFARIQGDRMILGDVFQTETGTWLPQLGSNQELIIKFPDSYDVRSSSRAFTNRTFYVAGPAEFDPSRPFAELERTGPLQDDLPNQTGGIPSALGISGVALLTVLIVVLLVRRNGGLNLGEIGTTQPEHAGAESIAGGTAADNQSDGAEEPLLSDEERILRLLEGNGGRMKQVNIVNETDWSNAKVSQLLSEMESKGVIDKLRIGRENLISLPGESPDDTE